MAELRALMELLRDGGPYGAIVVLLYMLRDLHVEVRSLQAARLGDIEKRVEDEKERSGFALALLEKTTSALRDVVDAAKRHA
jgi:hypothetical protein